MKPSKPEKLPLNNIQWNKLIPHIGKVNRAIALYDGILYSLPNPEVLLSPLTTQEAVLSSRIEGTQATLGDVLKFEAGEEIIEENKRLDITEIINYRKALKKAEQELKKRPFNLNLLFDLHNTLLNSVRGRNKNRGCYRTVQNWIGATGCSIDEAEYVPPDPSLVKELMNNWEEYYHADEHDSLVQLAIIHAQFEIIHPFLDGNGRIGRIIIPLFLYEKKILSRPMFYLSTYLESHRDEYIERLWAHGEPGSWESWIEFFLKALTGQAHANAEKAKKILSLYESLKERIIELTHSTYSIPLLDWLFRQPVFQSSALTTHKSMPSRPMVMALLNKLKEDGILKVLREGSGSRAQVLAFTELINLCEGKKVIWFDK